MRFDHRHLDYTCLDRAIREWMRLRRLRDAHGPSFDGQLKEAKQQIEAARVDLNQQRKSEVEAWARPRQVVWAG